MQPFASRKIVSENDPQIEEKIAAEFLRVMKTWFASDRPDVKITKQVILEANDYFDANMAMDEAFKNCGREVFTGIEQAITLDTMRLWNKAWERAAELAEAK